ncbi:MAG TPA: hypothetical protein VGN97_19385 [Mesorhizobium sp.]|jgi:hypothetical protein|nr:hypothetical protein [Mesorhizobium sp.]
MRAAHSLLIASLLAPWPASAGDSGCKVGNETLEATGRGSLTYGRTSDIWLHFAGLDGNVFEAGKEVAAHLVSNLPELTGRFPLPRPYTADGKRYSAFLLDRTFQHASCPGRQMTALCSLVFLKSGEQGTGASHAKVVCQLTVL